MLQKNEETNCCEENSKLETIFSELKKEREYNGELINPIDPERKLKKRRTPSLFQGQFHKIYYNDKYYSEYFEDVDVNVIRFILLHEEMHARGNNSEFISLIIGLIGIWSLSFLNIIQVTTMLLSLLIFAGIWYRYWYYTILNNEFEADDYAAKILKNCYNVESPSLTCRSMFEVLSEVQIPKNVLKIFRFIGIVIGLYPDYHPSDNERISRIKERYETS